MMSFEAVLPGAGWEGSGVGVAAAAGGTVEGDSDDIEDSSVNKTATTWSQRIRKAV